MNYNLLLKGIRENRNLTQEDIANILEIDRRTYNHYETKEKIIPIKHLVALSKYFDVSIDYLRDDIPEEPLKAEDVLKNAGNVKDGQIKLPKVVG